VFIPIFFIEKEKDNEIKGKERIGDRWATERSMLLSAVRWLICLGDGLHIP